MSKLSPVPSFSPGRRLARSLIGGLAAVLAMLLALPAGAQQDQAFPRRKPGLWEVRSTSAHASGMPATSHCVGEGSDVAVSHLDRSSGIKGSCTLGAFRRAGLAWVAESVCREGKTRVTSQAIASGDFATSYRIDTVVTYDPPLAGVKREDKEAIEARYVGPCGDGQKPGDMIIPGMGTLNMIDGTFRAEPAPPAARPPRQRPSPTEPAQPARPQKSS